MNVTNDMAETALDALDGACIGFQRSRNPSASVHWKGFTRDDRVAAMRTALSAALSKQDAAIALMRGQSEFKRGDKVVVKFMGGIERNGEVTHRQGVTYSVFLDDGVGVPNVDAERIRIAPPKDTADEQ